MVIDDKLLDSLLAQAAESPRLRTNFDLRNGPDDGSQRMLNAMLPGTQVPIHRHRDTSESFVVLRGSLTEIFYDESGVECARYELGAPGSNHASTHGVDSNHTNHYGSNQTNYYGSNHTNHSQSNHANHSEMGLGLQIPAGMWHTLIVHEPTVILECKDGAFAPLSSEDVWNYE